MSEFAELYTKEGLNLPDIPWNDYPRPLLKRDSFICLNGEWELEIKKGDDSQKHSIRVPFAPETLLSGLGVDLPESIYDSLIYRRCFTLPEGFNRGRVLLHFGAVSNYSEVALNGRVIGIHRGAYDSFFFDITDCLAEVNTVTVCVKNIISDNLLPYGKQSRKRGGMWYTATSGIWQTVWLESVPDEHIKSIRTDVDNNTVTVTAEGVDKAVLTLSTDGGDKTFEMSEGKCSFTVDEPKLWSPEEPCLYYFSLETPFDRVESYFAFRTLEAKMIDGVPRLCLNGKPYFFHGLLDQGYWSDGGMTPPSPESYAVDIKAMKALGFNMLRKHIKIEPAQFYYQCDRLGMVVFQDMINNGDYSFFRDTALPTVGIKRLSDKNMHRDPATREIFTEYMEKTVEILRGYPCICCWTIFNEGWGQFCGTEMYKRLKAIDSTRFVDTASGWFSKVESDVDSKHVYFKKVKLKVADKPLVLSEFGGYSYRVEGHIFNSEKEYGYGKYTKREDFVKAFCGLYENEILPIAEKGLSAAVYTQVSDVEDETNGLFTFDRRVLKIKPEEFAHISEKLKKQ